MRKDDLKLKTPKHYYLIFLLFTNVLFFTPLTAQDTISQYSIEQLDSINKALIDSADFNQLLPYAKVAVDKAKEIYGVEDTIYARMLYNLGYAYAKQKQIQQAISSFQEAIKIQKQKIPTADIYGNSLHQLGLMYYSLGDKRVAITHWEELAGIRKKNKSSLYAGVINNLGILYSDMGDYKQAESYFLEGMKARKELLGENDPSYASSLNSLGALYSDMGEYEKAASFHRSALAIRKRIYGVKHRIYASSLNNLGILYSDMGDYKQAEYYYLKGLEVKKEILGKRSVSYAINLSNLGIVYHRMTEYEKAKTFYLQAIDIYKETVGIKHSYYASVLNSLSLLYSDVKDYKQAEECYLQTIRIRKEVLGKDHPEYGSALFNLGTLYARKKEYEKAEPFLLKALAIRKKSLGDQHPLYASSLYNLGLLYLDMKRYDVTESYYKQALMIRKEKLGGKHPSYISNLNGLASMYIKKEEEKLVLYYLNEAIKSNTGNELNVVVTQESMDKLAETDYASMDELVRTIAILYSWNEKIENKKAQVLLSELILKLLNRSKNEVFEEADKLRLLAERSGWVLKSLKILNEENQITKAFEVAEQNKSVLLLDAGNANRAHSFGDLPDPLIRKEKDLQKKHASIKAGIAEKRSTIELDSLRDALIDVNKEMGAFKDEIKEKYPKYAKLKYQEMKTDVGAVQDNLDDKTALLEYVLGDSVVYVFYIDKKTIQMHVAPINNLVLANKVQLFHGVLSNYKFALKKEQLSYERYTKNAHWFYEELVAPVLSKKIGIEQLIIIPDGVLGHLPFETFLVKPGSQTQANYQNLHYLAMDYKISYNYSATLWSENKNKKKNKNNGKLLAIAANYAIGRDSVTAQLRLPIYEKSRGGLPILPAARREVEVLANDFSGLFAFDSLATERLFYEQAMDYGVIHLAMHGLLNSGNPMLSSLVFTENRDSQYNNFLQAYEISKMELNADLVVLSACETGYGKFEKGNGIASLARSFMYAGSPALIVSLWQVSDYATSIIMKKLYENLAQGLDKVTALHQAKETYRLEAKGIMGHPAFWSPFILIGNEEPVRIAKKGTLLPWLLIGGGLIVLLFIIGFLKRKK